ncbi:hypothetical protein [Hyalangium gracile]|uniref:hypothetical protein n=1 Tax=Hyalangium gracile TaxID=394092 RepID=UPI001CCA4179|nr:hypothetical protein [Hyalangium gracile]
MRRSRFALCLLVLSMSACDWEHYAMMNSIPARGEPSLNPVVRVYLGMDGLSHSAVVRARERGAFPHANLSRFVAMFPATSDSSWTRIFHTQRFAGYEFGHYDPVKDKVYNKALGGLLVHLVPPLEELPFTLPTYAQTPAYYRAFDYHASAYLDALWSYDRPVYGYYKGVDNVFAALAGRSQVQDTFTAYLLETDVIGHIRSEDDMVEVLVALSERIEKFKRDHPERTFIFTFFGDHGIDGIPKPEETVVDFRDQLEDAGVVTVESMEDADKEEGPAAIAILHTRVTYVAIHARPHWVAEVARRASTCSAADLVFARGEVPGPEFPQGLDWVSVWREGNLVARFGYDVATDSYVLPSNLDWAALDIPVTFNEGAPYGLFGDDALFSLTVDRTYPDFFFRARTAFEPISVQYPSDIIVSYRHPFMSVGYQAPIASLNGVGTGGSHGAMDRLGSVAALLSEERELPPVVRSDNLLELFPALVHHMRQREVELLPGAVGAELDYDRLP